MSLYDYELISGDQGKRLFAFGKYAGRAVIIDLLHGLGQRKQPCIILRAYFFFYFHFLTCDASKLGV